MTLLRETMPRCSSRGRLFALLLLLATLAAPACVTTPPHQGGALCGNPEFVYKDGWLGGDAAYSVPLSATRSLWLFGDSFVADEDLESRTGSTFIHNSIAISTCKPGSPWSIDYYWTRARGENQARAFFDKQSPDQYWWLFDGFVHRGALYIGLLLVEERAAHGPLSLPFSFAGMELARVANPAADPTAWQVEILPLWKDTKAIPGSSLVVHGDFLYLFSFLNLESGQHPRVLARLPLVALNASADPLEERVEYLAKDGSWKPGLDPDDARILMEDNASEMSVRFHRRLDRWIAVYSYPNAHSAEPELPASDAIYLRTARNLEGPWTPPVSIYRVPELQAGYRPGRDPNTGCYAAKEHPQLASEQFLLITYVCNLFTPPGGDPYPILVRLLDRMDLYRPRFVTLPIDAAVALDAAPAPAR